MNPFLKQLQRGLGARKVAPRRSQVSRFAPAPTRANGTITAGTNSYSKPVANANVIQTGRRSTFNEQTPLHNNAVSITITNNSATLFADIVLSAGRFNSAAEFSARLLATGAKNTTNLLGETVGVTTTAQFGVRATTSTIEEFHAYINQGAISVGAMRLGLSTKEQRAFMVNFERREMFGDDTLDQIFPEVYYSPNQYDPLVIQSDLGFPLDPQTIMSYKLRPSETVVFNLWVTGVYDPGKIMTDFVRRQGGSSLL